MQLRTSLVCNFVRLWCAISYEFGMQLRTSLVNESSPFAQRPLRFLPTLAAISSDYLVVMRICSVAVFSFFVQAGMLSATGCQPWGRGGLVCSPVLLSRFPFPPFFSFARVILIMCVFRLISFFHCRHSFLSLFFLFFRKKVRKKFAVSENSVTFALAFAHFGASAFRFSRLYGKSSLKVFHRRGSSTGRPFAFFALETL